MNEPGKPPSASAVEQAAINRSWHSSMEIGVKVTAENSFTGVQGSESGL